MLGSIFNGLTVWLPTQKFSFKALSIVTFPTVAFIIATYPPIYKLLNRHEQGRLLQQEEENQSANENPGDYLKVASELSRVVLGPVAKKPGTKRLLIVSDGALQLIPFGALPMLDQPNDAYQPLIVSNEIVNLPLASTMA